MLQQTFFLLLNVSFPPCFLSPLLLSLSLFFFFFFFFLGGGGARRERPRLNPRLAIAVHLLHVYFAGDKVKRNDNLCPDNVE